MPISTRVLKSVWLFCGYFLTPMHVVRDEAWAGATGEGWSVLVVGCCWAVVVALRLVE